MTELAVMLISSIAAGFVVFLLGFAHTRDYRIAVSADRSQRTVLPTKTAKPERAPEEPNYFRIRELEREMGLPLTPFPTGLTVVVPDSVRATFGLPRQATCAQIAEVVEANRDKMDEYGVTL